MGEWAYVVAGYGLTAVALTGYAAALAQRARRARRRAEEISRENVEHPPRAS